MTKSVRYYILCFGLLLTACQEEEVNPILATVTTHQASMVRVSSVTLGGRIVNDGGDEVFERGVCWGLYTNPTIGGSHVNLGKGLGEFQVDLERLEPDTHYYVRAYAESSAGVAYGNQISFTTNYTVLDLDSNIYHGITIGSQVWLQENLRVSRYNNLDTITHVPSNEQWAETSQGAWCLYSNQEDTLYGKLYNWYAVEDQRGICPEGWRVAKAHDWITLSDYLGGELVAGGKIKAPGDDWNEPNTGADGSTLFLALPGGYRSFTNGEFQLKGSYGYWWTSQESTDDEAKHSTLFYNNAGLGLSEVNKGAGYSVRCIRKEEDDNQ